MLNKYVREGKLGYMALLSVTISWISIFLGLIIYARTGNNLIYYFVSDSNKVLAIVTAVCVFVFFVNKEIKYSRIINSISSSTFGVLLIHANSTAMRIWLWRDTLKNVEFYNKGIGVFVCHAIISVFIVYFLCILLDKCRIELFERPIFKWIGKYKWIDKQF